MSEATNDVGWAAAAIGGFLGGFVGAAAGILAAAWFWDTDLITIVVGGAVFGGVPAMLTAGAMAFHGSAIGASNELPSAFLWGIAAGAVTGLSVNPVMGLVGGWALGAPGLGGVTGLLLGAVAGVIGWQTGYWLAHMSAR